MDKIREKQYELLFNRLFERGEALHASNKKRIRIGLIFLAVFTVGMIVIRYITDSDRATFLIIWVIGMFAISIYLIGVEYIDTSLAKTLEEVTEREAGWDMLLPDSETMAGIVQDRIDDRRDDVKGRINERRNEVKDLINERREELEDLIQTAGKSEPAKEKESDEEEPAMEKEDDA